VRRYVRDAKRRLGLRTGPELCVPQQYALGEEAQVDWYEGPAGRMEAPSTPWLTAKAPRHFGVS